MRYSSNVRSRIPRRRGEKSSLYYLMPFIILICVGLIVILVFKLYQSVFDTTPRSGVAFYAVSGEAQMKAWGTNQFVDFPSGTYLMEGDELMSSKDARIILHFPDGTIMRMGGDTDIILEELSFEDVGAKIKIMLVNGQLWGNKVYMDTGNTAVVVKMSNIVFNSSGSTVFELENIMEESVRVLGGAVVSADVLSEDSGKVVESVKIAVGQEVVFDSRVLDSFRKYQSPNVLSALSDFFRSTEWYEWNVSEDKKPTNFSGEPRVLDENGFIEVLPEGLEGESSPETETDEDYSVDDFEQNGQVDVEVGESAGFAAPSVLSVSGIKDKNEDGFYVVTSHLATITGEVSGANEVWVNDYMLQQFKLGDATWTYMANAKYDLMKEGENFYDVYAVDADGNKSSILTVKVLYKPAPVVSAPAPVVETPDSAEDEVEEQEPSEAEDLVVPVVDEERPDWLN